MLLQYEGTLRVNRLITDTGKSAPGRRRELARTPRRMGACFLADAAPRRQIRCQRKTELWCRRKFPAHRPRKRHLPRRRAFSKLRQSGLVNRSERRQCTAAVQDVRSTRDDEKMSATMSMPRRWLRRSGAREPRRQWRRVGRQLRSRAKSWGGPDVAGGCVWRVVETGVQ